MQIKSRLLLFSIFFISLIAQATETVYLTTPNLADSNIIGYNVGLRPYRSSGIRLETEQLVNKLIVHNYGRRGGGISLSWGSAQEAIRLMQMRAQASPNSTIAILGSGINGLTVANQLLDMGFHVRIYAKAFPPHTTSEIAAGLWSPFGVVAGETEEARQRFENMTAASYDHFYELATSTAPRFAGTSIVDGYYFYRDHQPRLNDPKRTIVNVEFDNGLRMSAEHSKNIMIETPTYMQELMRQAQNRGAEFVQRIIYGQNDLLALDENIIFNCMGLGSKEVFNDQDLKPTRGQLVYFKAQKGIDYIAASYGKEGSSFFTCFFPYKDKFVLGGTYEEGEVQSVIIRETCDDIVKQARHLFAPALARDEL